MNHWITVFLVTLNLTLPAQASVALDQFLDRSARIPTDTVKSWPLMHNGRLKPFETLAQETSLFLTGKYSFKGLSPVQFILGIMGTHDVENLDLIEVRSADLRKQLALDQTRRHFSPAELKATKLQELATAASEKEKVNKRSLSEVERKTLEAMEQVWLLEQIAGGGFLIGSMEPQLQADHSGSGAIAEPWVKLLQSLLQAADQGSTFEFEQAAQEIRSRLQQQKWPPAIAPQLNNIDLEIQYNQLKPFRWACWLFFLFAILLLQETWLRRQPAAVTKTALFLPLLFVIIGFFMRISVTGFAPVTNMYGTMLWVSLGVGLFGWLFYLIYQHSRLLSLMYFGAFLLLLLTEQIPLVISPDMDPIVAVLRSNLWLTIHVLTITISYAAFTMSMLLGNATMFAYLAGRDMKAWVQTYGHFCYRAIQLGVFLLSVGIILGGVWADYSWGRFWGWDPKETWALIADLGYLTLLHARFVGWVTPFRLLILSPAAYLLVIMAWYGVNFILATGLHSYGFSSGGATIVFSFVAVQLLVLATTLVVRFVREKRFA